MVYCEMYLIKYRNNVNQKQIFLRSGRNNTIAVFDSYSTAKAQITRRKLEDKVDVVLITELEVITK